MSPDFIINLVNSAPDDVLLMSRRNCHALNVDSIVIRKDQGPYGEQRLTRIFLAAYDHQLWKNLMPGATYTVGIHDHKYHLNLSMISGSVLHMKYDTHFEHGGVRLNHFTFEPGNVPGKPVIVRKAPRAVFLTYAEPLKRTEPLHANQLHSMACQINVSSSWMVEELSTVKQYTNLYTNAEKVEVDGLYEPFHDVDQIRRRVRNFYGRS